MSSILTMPLWCNLMLRGFWLRCVGSHKEKKSACSALNNFNFHTWSSFLSWSFTTSFPSVIKCSLFHNTHIGAEFRKHDHGHEALSSFRPDCGSYTGHSAQKMGFVISNSLRRITFQGESHITRSIDIRSSSPLLTPWSIKVSWKSMFYI